MGWRFRKSENIGKHGRLNFSKSGVSFSLRDKFNSLNFNKDGVRHTFRFPGTGVSYSEHHDKSSIKHVFIIIVLLILATVFCCCCCGGVISCMGIPTETTSSAE